MQTSAYLYPWDLVGDPAAAPRLVTELAVHRVVIAAAYHTVRAWTPRHPRHAVVDAAHAAVYFPLRTQAWRPPLVPRPATWVAGPGSYPAAARAARAAGLSVDAWIVVTHTSVLARAHPHLAVQPAVGGPAPHALCPAQPAVRDYAATVIGETVHAHRPDGIEVEHWGWPGPAHQGHHDKTTLLPLPPAPAWLARLCFCRACADGYLAHGLRPEALRRDTERIVRRALCDDLPDDPAEPAADAVARLLGRSRAEAVAATRQHALARLRARLREAASAGSDVVPLAFRVDPDPLGGGAFVGWSSPDVGTGTDRAVVLCQAPEQARAALARLHGVRGLIAHLPLSGTDPPTVRRTVEALREVDEIRVYHGGALRPAHRQIVRTLTVPFLSERENP